MKQRVSVVVAAAVLAAACGNKSSSSPSGSASGSGSDPWAAKGTGAASASGSGSASGSDDCPPKKDEPAPEAVTAKLTRPFFFHATKAGMANLWLFGTIHLGVAPDAIPDATLAALDKSERFAMEADINDPSLLADIMRTDGKKLSDELGPETWHKFACAIGPSTAARLENMKASTAATLLDVQGMAITQPMDMFLLMRAKKDGKGIVFLETAKKQLAILDKWMDARAIKEGVEDLDEGKQKNLELIADYVAGDEAKSIEMSKDDSDFVKEGRTHEEFGQFMKELLFDRNASWIDEIEDMAKKGDAFVAVGALHLLGDGSVVDLLEKKGWKIERVDISAAPAPK
jgi:uncharacterized protein YbaP (TraB family)